MKAFFSKIKSLADQVINLGVDEDWDMRSKMRAKLINTGNISNILGTISSSIVITFMMNNPKMLITSVPWLILSISSLYLSYKQKFNILAHGLIALGIIYTIAFHLIFGNNVEMLSIYLLEIQSVFLLFKLKVAKKYIAVVLSGLALSYTYCLVYGSFSALPYEATAPLGYINNGIAFLLFILVGIRLRSESVKHSEILQERNKLLAEKNEQLNRFKYIVSHDLKEPVRSIVSFSNLLKRYKDDSEKRKEFSQYIVKSGEQFNRLVDNIRDYQELEHLEIKKENVNLNKVIEDAQLALNLMISNRNVTIQNHGLPTIRASHYSLILVLKNLIENGIRFNNNPSPIINIWAKKTGKTLKIFIKDNGIGIDSDYHQQIFELFKRLGTDATKGSGLGLNIAKRIINQLDGDLILHHSELGVGSTFAITFPTNSIVSEEEAKTPITLS